MVLLAGALGFDQSGAHRQAAEKVAQATARYPTLQQRLLYNDAAVALFTIERTQDNPKIVTYEPSANEQVWLLGDVNYAESCNKINQFPPTKVPGRWLAVKRDQDAQTLQIATDRLGLAWLYIAKLPNGYVFSSDFAALAANVASDLTLDYDTALLELAVGYSPDDRTIFNEITVAPPGAVIQLRADGITVLAKRKIEYGQRFAHLSREQKYRILDRAFDNIVKDRINAFASGIILSLSGGYDSRYALAFLDRHSIEPQLFTFGNPDSLEVVKARAVCARIGRTTNVFPIREISWEDWRQRVALLGNCGMVQWSGWAGVWLTHLRAHGRASVIGYLGDALTGKHLGSVTNDKDRVEYWANWSARGGWADSPLLREGARSRLRECLTQRMTQATEEATGYAFPCQKALHLDLYGRQRRFVASQPNLISRFLTPILFFYDDELIDFWMNVGPGDLDQQRLYLAYAQSAFPRLFPVGEEQPPSITARAARKARHLIGRLTGQDKTSERRPLAIEHEQIIMPNKRNIVELANRVAGIIGDVVDVPEFCRHVEGFNQVRTISSYEIIKAVNLFILLDMCCRQSSAALTTASTELSC